MADFPYKKLRDLLDSTFHTEDDCVFFAAEAPGRLEIAGNHTDYQGGVVISAAMNLKAYGLATANNSNLIRVAMDGFGTCEIDISKSDWHEPRDSEKGKSVALIRGMAANAYLRGMEISGFDMATCSDIPVGCGVSSSAAFEILMGIMLEAMFAENSGGEDAAGVVHAADPVALALEGVDAENRFFGKPSGAQDQLASAHGGAIYMDFSQYPPDVERIVFDPAADGFSLCMIDSQVDHALYGDEFALITEDLAEVANYFGCKNLFEVTEERFLSVLPDVRLELGDRCVLRALHFFDEVNRVKMQRDNIVKDDWLSFMKIMRLSGASSAELLQNVSPKNPNEADNVSPEQPRIILALCEHLLSECGSWRIHGGGFGGSVVAFMASDKMHTFKTDVDRWLGYDAVMPINVIESGARAWRIP